MFVLPFWKKVSIHGLFLTGNTSVNTIMIESKRQRLKNIFFFHLYIMAETAQICISNGIILEFSIEQSGIFPCGCMYSFHKQRKRTPPFHSE
jgi:hypothetical protein